MAVVHKFTLIDQFGFPKEELELQALDAAHRRAEFINEFYPKSVRLVEFFITGRGRHYVYEVEGEFYEN